jgi:hypothetical protein
MSRSCVERNAKAGPPNTSFLAAPERLIFRLMAAPYPTQNTPIHHEMKAARLGGIVHKR